MNEESLQSALQSLATQAGLAADHFWPILVRQQIMEGVLFYCAFVLSLGIFLILFREAKPHFDEKELHHTETAVLISVIPLFVLSVGGFAKGLALHPFNPQFYALKELAHMLRGG